MKNKIAIASVFLAAASFSNAEIVVNDFLSFEGFVDMSYYHAGGDDDVGIYNTNIGGVAPQKGYSDNSFQIDQVEIDWLFDFDPVTAQIDLQYDGGSGSSSTGSIVEQAFATYHFDNGGAVTAGRYASMLGFEAFEPTGLYQYSFAYDVPVLLPGYNQGVKYTYETDTTFFGISLQDSGVTDTYDNRLGGNNNSTTPGQDDGGFGVEVAGSINMDNGLTFFLGGDLEDGDNGDSYIINSYATYETGAWIFAAELNYGQTDIDPYGIIPAFVTHDETDVLSALIMANFAYSEAASITGRISYVDADTDVTAGGTGYSGDGNLIKYTLAHGYAFTDNLFLVTEVSYADGEINDANGFVNGDFDQLSGAVELLFSF